MTDVRLDVEGCVRVVLAFDEVEDTLRTALRALDAGPVPAAGGWWSLRAALVSVLVEHHLDGEALERTRRAVVAADGDGWPGTDDLRRGWNGIMAAVIPATARQAWTPIAIGAGAVDDATAPWRVAGRWLFGDDDSAGWIDPADPGGTFDRRSVAPFPGVVGSPEARGRGTVAHLVAGTSGVGPPGATGPQAAADEFQLIDHGHDTYSIVLGGVIDLGRPELGLNPDHRSVRDLDVNAVDAAFAGDPGDDRYATLVAEGVRRAGVPPGADLLVVGHSYGAGAAVQLAADRAFNGDEFTITHVVATGYHADPWLADVATGTDVLLLKNRWDLIVAAEALAHRAIIDDPDHDEHQAVVRTFDGGFSRAGHKPGHYVDYVTNTDDAAVGRFLTSVGTGGYHRPGTTTAIDVSVPED